MQGLDIAQQKTKMRFSASYSSYRKPQSACRLLSYLSLYDSNLTTIVATRWANSVVKVESTAVAALSERRSYSSIMGATLEGTSLRLSSFRMCHCCIVFCIIILGVLRIIYNDDCSRIYGYRKVRKWETNKMMQRCKAKNDEVANFSELGYGVCRPCLMLWFQNEISVLLSAESSSAEKRLIISALHFPSGCTRWSGKFRAIDS